MFGNVFGIFELPKFAKLNWAERLFLGGWQLNSVAHLSNGILIGAPGNVDIVGNYRQGNQSIFRQFNTCYQSVSIVNNAAVYSQVNTTYNSSGVPTITACDAQSSTVAFRQRLAYTSQSNSNVLNIRYKLVPLMDASLFKQFALREGMSLELRGEFFNLLNTPNFAGPSTSLGAANAGSAASASGVLTQASDPRIGQLTVRLNF
jgi:hypothetical protein